MNGEMRLLGMGTYRARWLVTPSLILLCMSYFLANRPGRYASIKGSQTLDPLSCHSDIASVSSRLGISGVLPWRR
ncbi:hypothetical protein GGS23DRAFT_193551 [Durotheca rogersii]|uniref:uncharacterized protein n=1 Tax=Durotheca rogersii TaxID=419775 RepID=UPI00221F88BC|nr:uncharacterized protein GGS23DRAFT_193551 [Durotheca rogersii]KAI5867757.1 hypothetical protein GGS23DRAFT_193551 [Durotheca rogersii]